MIPGVSNDIISDIATNIIRQPLIKFTQDACRFYEIPLAPDVDSGPMWDPHAHEWFSEFVDLPVTGTGRLLLVPKSTYEDAWSTTLTSTSTILYSPCCSKPNLQQTVSLLSCLRMEGGA